MYDRIEVVTIWVVRVAWTSVLWMAFTVVGLGLLGIGPATMAMATVTRRWVLGPSDIPIFATFWSTYRQEFVRTNLLAGIMMAVSLWLLWDTHAALQPHPALVHLVLVPIIVVDAAFAAIVALVFALYADRHLNHVWQYFRLAALVGLLNPGRTLAMLAIFYLGLFVIKGPLLLLAVSLVMYLVTRFTLAGLSRVEQMVGNANQVAGDPSKEA